MTFLQVADQIVNLAEIEVAKIDQNPQSNDDVKPHVFLGMSSGDEIAFKGPGAAWLWKQLVALCESRVFNSKTS